VKRLILIVALIAAVPGWAPAAEAQAYPSKPIRIVVPFPAGGIADIYARLIGNRVAESWGQPVVVENRTGAGGNIGADLVAKSPADGYSLVMGTLGTHAVNVTLFAKLPYDPVQDFSAVALVLEAEGLLVVHPSLAVQNLRELIAHARAKPGTVTFASAGMGTASHLAAELFKSMAKVDMVHVPYKGNVPRSPISSQGRRRSSSPRCRLCCRMPGPASCARSRPLARRAQWPRPSCPPFQSPRSRASKS
jgi:tripartite-type tricarboxylate transporter receptor subunit TctC